MPLFGNSYATVRYKLHIGRALGVAVAGYYIARRAERDSADVTVTDATGARRVRDGWELVPMERR